MNIHQRQEHVVTVTHKLDPAQFAAIAHLATLFLTLVGTAMDQADPAVVKALTERLKASSDALEAAVKANEPNP